MKNATQFDNGYLWDPVVFRPGFNENSDKLNVNQAWSLFFSAGKEDGVLGVNPELGRFFTNLLIAVGVSVAIWGSFFSHLL
jgi:hypothetical protein